MYTCSHLFTLLALQKHLQELKNFIFWSFLKHFLPKNTTNWNQNKVTGISLFIVQLTRKLQGFPCFCNSQKLLLKQGNPCNCAINREIPVTSLYAVLFTGKSLLLSCQLNYKQGNPCKSNWQCICLLKPQAFPCSGSKHWFCLLLQQTILVVWSSGATGIAGYCQYL